MAQSQPFDFDAAADAAGREFNVNPLLIKALGMQESGLNPNAPRGSSGEIGMMQIMPATAEGLGVDPSDPNDAVRGAAKYLAQGIAQADAMRAQGVDVDPATHAVMYYNGGPRGWTNAGAYAQSVGGHYRDLIGAANAGAAPTGPGAPLMMVGMRAMPGGGPVGPDLMPAGGAAAASGAGAGGDGGLDVDSIVNGIASGRLTVPAMPRLSAAAPVSGPAFSAAGGAAAGGADGGGQAPALDVAGLVQTYNQYRSFPAGVPIATQVLGMLQKMAPEGFQVNMDGSLSPRAGYAQGEAAVAGAREEAQQRAQVQYAGPIAAAKAAGVAPYEMVEATVQTPNGPVKMQVPKDQYEQAMRAQFGAGGAAPAVPSATPSAPAATPGAPAATPGATPAGGAATPAAPGATPTGGVAPVPTAPVGGLQITGTPVAPLGYDEATKAMNELRTSASQAQDELATIQSMRDLMGPNGQGIKTGWGAEARADAGRFLTALGVDPESVKGLLGIAPADADAFQKQALRLSSEAVRQMGAREPGSVISMFTRAYPSLETQPAALDLMTNMLAMQARRTQDRRDQVLAQWQQGGGGYGAFTQADAAFDRSNPATNYLHAAEAITPGYHQQAWGSASPDEMRAIFGLIPVGRRYTDISGTLRTRGMPAPPAPVSATAPTVPPS